MQQNTCSTYHMMLFYPPRSFCEPFYEFQGIIYPLNTKTSPMPCYLVIIYSEYLCRNLCKTKKIAIGMVTNSYLSLIIFVLEVFSYLSSFPLVYLLFPASSDRLYSKTENLTILGSFIFIEVFRCHW